MKIILYRVKDDEIILSREMFTYLLECKKQIENEEFGKKVTKELKIKIKDKLSKQNKEISRLNNIIDELEKHLQKDLTMEDDFDEMYYHGYQDCVCNYLILLKALRELKEGKE